MLRWIFRDRHAAPARGRQDISSLKGTKAFSKKLALTFVNLWSKAVNIQYGGTFPGESWLTANARYFKPDCDDPI